MTTGLRLATATPHTCSHGHSLPTLATGWQPTPERAYGTEIQRMIVEKAGLRAVLAKWKFDVSAHFRVRPAGRVDQRMQGR
jgi:hypothetical protein